MTAVLNRRLAALAADLAALDPRASLRRLLMTPEMGELLRTVDGAVAPFPAVAAAHEATVRELLAEAGIAAAAVGTGAAVGRAALIALDPTWTRVREALFTVLDRDDDARAAALAAISDLAGEG